MSSFTLKIIGIITMLLDHIGFFFYSPSFLRVIGRIAFPIFAFQSVVGYEHTKDKKKHLLKLFVFGLISQIPFSLMHIITKKAISLNVMFTIFFGLLAISIFNKFKNKIDGFIAVILIGVLGLFLRVDYDFFGIMSIFLFYYFRNNKIKAAIAFSILFIIRYVLNIIYMDTLYYIFILLATLSALIPINLYNNKEGIKAKYLFYIFYPLHMIILCLIYYFIK